MKKIDNYTYLSKKGFFIERNKILDKDVNFIAEIYKRIPWKQISILNDDYIKGEPISEEEISALMLIKNKYDKTKYKKEQVIGWKYYDLYKAIDFLLETISKCGYGQSHPTEYYKKIYNDSSILITSIALFRPQSHLKLFPDFPDSNQTITEPNNKYRRLCFCYLEPNPTLILYENKNSFYCTKCKKRGNIFKFIMMSEQITFYKTLATLKKAFNIDVPLKDLDTPHQNIVEKILEVMENDEYKELLSNSAEQKEKYLEKRLKLTTSSE